MFFGSVEGINRLISKGMPNVYLRLKKFKLKYKLSLPNRRSCRVLIYKLIHKLSCLYIKCVN